MIQQQTVHYLLYNEIVCVFSNRIWHTLYPDLRFRQDCPISIIPFSAFQPFPLETYEKNTVALTLNLMNTLYVGRLISNLMPSLFDIFRINIKYVGQHLSKL